MASEWAQLPHRIKEVLLTFKKGYETLNTHGDMLTLAERTHVDNPLQSDLDTQYLSPEAELNQRATTAVYSH